MTSRADRSRGGTAIEHTIRVPFPVDVVLSQFFDFEHVPHVHRRSLGRVELRTVGPRWAIADLRWPLLPGVRVRSGFRQEYRPPDVVVAEVIDGWGRGARYEAHLSDDDGGTRVDERLVVPGWKGRIAAWFRPWILRRMRRVWDEDLRVGMCRGGWPGPEVLGIVGRAPGRS